MADEYVSFDYAAHDNDADATLLARLEGFVDALVAGLPDMTELVAPTQYTVGARSMVWAMIGPAADATLRYVLVLVNRDAPATGIHADNRFGAAATSSGALYMSILTAEESDAPLGDPTDDDFLLGGAGTPNGAPFLLTRVSGNADDQIGVGTIRFHVTQPDLGDASRDHLIVAAEFDPAGSAVFRAVTVLSQAGMVNFHASDTDTTVVMSVQAAAEADLGNAAGEIQARHGDGTPTEVDLDCATAWLDGNGATASPWPYEQFRVFIDDAADIYVTGSSAKGYLLPLIARTSDNAPRKTELDEVSGDDDKFLHCAGGLMMKWHADNGAPD